MKIINIKIRAFSCERSAKEHQVGVEDDGTVRVYDDVAGYFTLRHDLSELQMARCRKCLRT